LAWFRTGESRNLYIPPPQPRRACSVEGTLMHQIATEVRPSPLQVMGACAVWFGGASLLGAAVYLSQQGFNGHSIVYLVQGVLLGIIGSPVFGLFCYLTGSKGISMLKAAGLGAAAALFYVVVMLFQDPTDETGLAFKIGYSLTAAGIGAALGVVATVALRERSDEDEFPRMPKRRRPVQMDSDPR
jgi:hypothetical protein